MTYNIGKADECSSLYGERKRSCVMLIVSPALFVVIRQLFKNISAGFKYDTKVRSASYPVTRGSVVLVTRGVYGAKRAKLYPGSHTNT